MLLFIASIFYVILYLKPSLVDFDENYTIRLIQHSYKHLIYLDSLDVHPPLYYISLKFFINSTTGWSEYLPLKIFSARIYSLLISIIMFIFLRKITFVLHISHNLFIQWVLLVILPNVLGFKFSLQQLTDIRMYSLSALFVVIEFYYLLKFYKYNTNKELLIATISAILASYTHYYSAMFCGILLFIYFTKFLIRRDIFISAKIMFAGLVFGLSFLPWMPIFLNQITNSTNYWMTYKIEYKQIIIFISLIVIFIYPIMKYCKIMKNNLFNKEICVLVSVILIVFIFSMIYSIFKGPIFQYRYMYSILIIYEFIGLNTILSLINRYHIFEKYFIILLSIFGCLIFLSVTTQIFTDEQSWKAIKTYNVWSSNPHVIYIIHGNENYDTNYISYVSWTRNLYIVPRSSMRAFKLNSHIYNNHAYRTLFHSTIKRIYFKKE